MSRRKRRWAVGIALLLLLALAALVFQVVSQPPSPPPQQPAAASGGGTPPAAERTEPVESEAPERIRGRRTEAPPAAGPPVAAEGRRLVVTVRERRGEPYDRPVVARAGVGLLDTDDLSLPQRALPHRTGADGRAVLFPQSERVRVYARRGTDAVVSRVVKVPRGEERRVELVLLPGVAIRGRVVDDDGGPVPDARLRLHMPTSLETMHFGTSRAHRPLQSADVVVPLDEQAGFAIPRVPAPVSSGTFVLHASAAGHVPVAYAIPAHCGDQHEVEIALLRAVLVRGRVVADVSPAPEFEAVSVVPGPRSAMPGERAGEFVFPTLPARGGTFVVRADGFAPRAVHWPATSEPVIDVGDVQLDGGQTLTGAVHWPDGTPVHGAKVQVRSDHVEGRRLITSSKPDGSFTFRHLAAVEHRVVSSRKTNWWITMAEHAAQPWPTEHVFGSAVADPVVPGRRHVRLVLESGPVVRLRFVDSRTGAGAEVRSPRLRAGTRGEKHSVGSNYLGTAYGVAFPLDTPGPWRIEITSETHETTLLDLVNVARTELRDLALTPKDPSGE